MYIATLSIYKPITCTYVYVQIDRYLEDRYLEILVEHHTYVYLSVAAQLVNDWSGYLQSCIYRNMGFCFDYGFSHAVHLATFDSTHTFQYM